MRSKGALIALFSAGLLADAARAVEGRTEESDVVGTWYVDADVFRSDLERELELQFAGMPEIVRIDTMAAAKRHLERSFERGMAYAEFRPGGEVIFHTADDPPSAGFWSVRGERIRFKRRAQIEDEPGYDGTIDEGVMRVEPDAKLPMTVPLTLRRA
jgi:hypothetical protein